MDKKQEAIIKDLSESLKIDEDKAKSLYRFYMKFIRDKMEEGVIGDIDSFQNIRIPNFGIFYMKESAYIKVNENNKKK